MRENWERYTVNTISIDHVKYILCMEEGDTSMSQSYVIVKPELTLYSVQLRDWNNMWLIEMKLIYFLIKSIATTGHKLQGKTLDELVVNSFAYG